LRFYLYRKITEPGTYEVRGVAMQAVGGADISWDATDFPGFYYDLNNNLGGESLQLSLSASPTKDSSEPAEAVYRTVAEECEFDFEKWQKYYAIGFLGEKCFAGYVDNDSDPQSNSKIYSESTDVNLMDDEILSPVLIDDDDEREPMGVGSAIALNEGYELKITSIDTKGDKIVVKLSKDGKDVEPERVLDLNEESDYCYKRNLGSSGEIVTIAVHFNNAFSGSEANMATVQGVWQISDTPIDIAENRKIGKMTIQSVNSRIGEMSMEMNDEDDTVKLGSDKDISLMGDICIKTSDLSDKPSDTPLKLYVYKKVTLGTGETETKKTDRLPDKMDVSRPDTGNATTHDNASVVPEKPEGTRGTPGFTSIMAFIGLLAMLFARRSGQ
jgi:S-layer protein (TIGR01567 family)